MDRRQFVKGATAAIGTVALPLRAAAPTGPDADFRAMLDRFFYGRLEDQPQQATRLGLDTGPRAGLKARLDDESVAGAAKRLARAKAERAELAKVTPARLSPASKLDYDVVSYQLDQQIAGAERFRYGDNQGRFSPYVLSQMSGPYRDVPDFLESQHRVRDATEADAYLARLAELSKAIDDSTTHQKADAAHGVFAPDYILDTTLKQLGAVLDKPAEQSVMVTTFAAKLKAANLSVDQAGKAAGIIRDAVLPAMERQRALVTDLRARAVHDAGCWRLPDGDAY